MAESHSTPKSAAAAAETESDRTLLAYCGGGGGDCTTLKDRLGQHVHQACNGNICGGGETVTVVRDSTPKMATETDSYSGGGSWPSGGNYGVTKTGLQVTHTGQPLRHCPSSSTQL